MKFIIKSLIVDAFKKMNYSNFIFNKVINNFKVDYTKNKKFGDFFTNISLVIAKVAKKNPMYVAKHMVVLLPKHIIIKTIEIAYPGFINFFISYNEKFNIIKKILEQSENYGKLSLGDGKKILIEFVSANPTGPLHVGHGRIAVFGSILSNLFELLGYRVIKEYYINDFGKQVDILLLSIWLIYLNLVGEHVTFPIGIYRNEYVKNIANYIYKEYGLKFKYSWNKIKDKWLSKKIIENEKEEVYIDFLIGITKTVLGNFYYEIFYKNSLFFIICNIKKDLSNFKIYYDNWISEYELLNSGVVQNIIEKLKKNNCTYISNGALWFKSTKFGDEKDRVLIRSNGSITYFASDIAYHIDKYNRGFDKIINIFGCDHHGYVGRIKSAMKSFNYNVDILNVLLVQFVVLYRDGKYVKLSKRNNYSVSLHDLYEELGNDVIRFFYIMRKSDQYIEFDLNLAKLRSNENPVYYIQYAYARICSVIRQVNKRKLCFDKDAGLLNLSLLNKAQELEIISFLNKYLDVIVSASKFYDPHRISCYLLDLSSKLHSYYNSVSLLCKEHTLRNARLCLIKSVGQILKNGLDLLGISSPERM
ncbi:arginine--tRNA ligase [Candidatus Legionella polyplacis]|uniref:arginine--tRNA ligase n=1 Tax=Candidatus Legionella polyplacis TaxID=2005262 RepID=UPI000C1F1588|nr:arginine--tRNA ligase [Candidatus Legionella polyplacis]ATW02036.1 arginine--tRNA ligase [Candidatus Legionella polyplacis]